MMDILDTIAHKLGAGIFFRAHSHHIPRMTRVLMVGGIGAIWQTIIFNVLGVWAAIVSPSTATLMGAEVAIISNFTLNSRFNFTGDEHRKSPLLHRLLKFHLVSSGSLLTQWICMRIAEGMSRDALFLNAAFIIGVGIGFIVNYSGYYWFVWRSSSSKD